MPVMLSNCNNWMVTAASDKHRLLLGKRGGQALQASMEGKRGRQAQQYRSEKVLELPLMPDMPERVGARRREPGMLKTAAMVSLASLCRCMLSGRSLPMHAPPLVLLHKHSCLQSCAPSNYVCPLARSLNDCGSLNHFLMIP